MAVGASTNAAIYALIALSLVLVYRGSGVVNFGVGYIAAFGGIFFSNFGAGGWPALVTSLAVGGLLGMAAYLLSVRIGERSGASTTFLAMATLGFGLVLEYFAGKFWAKEGFSPKPLWRGSEHVGGVTISHERILTVIAAAVCFLIVLAILEKSMIGWAMEAVAYRRSTAASYGVNTVGVTLVVWLLAGVIATLAGSLLAPVTSISREVALPLAIQGFAAAVVGGLGSVSGAVLGAIVVSVVQALVVQYISTSYASAFAFILLFVVLALKPQGIMGGRRQVRHT